MDLPNSVQILCVPGKAVPMDSVRVRWSKDFSMKTHPSLHSTIDEIWSQNLLLCKNLFNASKFRLHRVEEDVTNHHATLCLGETNYKEFIGTNCAPHAEDLVRKGIEDFGDPQAYLADPLGVGAIVRTVDEKLVFMRRSQNLAEMRGMIDRPGGHPEPDEVKKSVGRPLSQDDASFIVEELFQSVVKEIRDEINIPLSNLGEPLLLGISYNPFTFKRPSAEFYVQCSLLAEEVENLYQRQTQLEAEESTELVMVPVSELEQIQASSFFVELTPAAKSALYLFNIFLSSHL